MSDERTRRPPSERFATDSLLFDLPAEAAALRAEPDSGGRGHRQKTLFKHGGRTVALFVFEAGAVLAEHSARGTVTIQALEGALTVGAAGASHRLAPGSLIVLQPGVPHDVRAESDAVFLLQVSLEAPGPA